MPAAFLCNPSARFRRLGDGPGDYSTSHEVASALGTSSGVVLHCGADFASTAPILEQEPPPHGQQTSRTPQEPSCNPLRAGARRTVFPYPPLWRLGSDARASKGMV